MRFSHLYISLVLLLVVSGCRKVSFEDSALSYVGTWKWVGTTLGRPNMEDYPPVENMIPAARDFEFSLKEKGVIVIYDSFIPCRGRVTAIRDRGSEINIGSPILNRFTKSEFDNLGLILMTNDTLYVFDLDLMELNFPHPFENYDEKYYFVRQ